MIVELCGVPAAGKTTTARQLVYGLREYGHKAELISSYRPTETNRSLGCVASSVRRLVRPVWETLAAAGHVISDEQHEHLVIELLRLFHLPGLFSSVRNGQYLLRLHLAWERAARSQHIVLFDQGFIQGLAALMVLSRTAKWAAIERAFKCIPKPDLLIRVHAPEELLKARLSKRRQRQSRFERLLELDLGSNLRFGPAVDVLCAIYDRQIAPVIPVHTGDSVSRDAALARIRRQAEGVRLVVCDDADAA